MKYINNKHGWSFNMMIAFLMLFVFCLIMAAIGIRQLQNADSNTNDSTTSIFNNDSGGRSYSELQKEMTEKAIERVYDIYGNEPFDETRIITISELLDKGYIQSFKDEEGKDCSGYVEVYYDSYENMKTGSYLHCRWYSTAGYDEDKDK